MRRLIPPIAILALLVGGGIGWSWGHSTNSVTALNDAQQKIRTDQTQISTLKTDLATSQGTIDSLKAQQEKLQADYNALQVQVGLLEDGLAVYTSAHDLVVAYAKAVQARNGAAVRAYLAPTLKETVPPTIIGSSNPAIARHEIRSEKKGSGAVVETAVVRFYETVDGKPFDYRDGTLTVGKGSDGRYLITAVQLGAAVKEVKPK